jgi:hypothetical protein
MNKFTESSPNFEELNSSDFAEILGNEIAGDKGNNSDFSILSIGNNSINNSKLNSGIKKSGTMSLVGSLNGSNLSMSRDSVTSNATSTVTSSKAVLAALRALQDKIRRIEGEKAAAVAEVHKIQLQMKNTQIENEMAKHQETLAWQKTLEELQASNDKLNAERKEFLKLEDKIKEYESAIEEYQKTIRAMDSERHVALMKTKEIETKQSYFESQLKSYDMKEKELLNTMMWDKKRYETTLKEMNSKLKSYEEDLAITSKQNILKDTKIFELEQVVNQMISLNEAMMVQLGVVRPGRKTSSLATTTGSATWRSRSRSGSRGRESGSHLDRTVSSMRKSINVNESISLNSRSLSAQKSPKSTVKAVIPRIPVVSPASFQKTSNNSSNYNNKKSEGDQISYLIQMHNMYASMAKSISSKPSDIKVAATSSPSKSQREKTRSNGTPKSKRGSSSQEKTPSSTRLSSKIKKNKAKSRSEQYDSNEVEDDTSLDLHDFEVEMPRSNNKLSDISRSHTDRTNSNNNSNIISVPSVKNYLYSSLTHIDSDDINYQQNSASKPNNKTLNGDVEERIAVLESEMATMNQEYQQFLAFNFLKDSNKDGTSSIDTGKADQLINLIKKLKAKEEQLKQLRNLPN